MVRKEAYSITELSTILPLGRRTIFNHVRDGKIPSITIGGKIMVPKSYVDGLFAETGYPREETAGVAS